MFIYVVCPVQDNVAISFLYSFSKYQIQFASQLLNKSPTMEFKFKLVINVLNFSNHELPNNVASYSRKDKFVCVTLSLAKIIEDFNEFLRFLSYFDKPFGILSGVQNIPLKR